MNAPTTGPNTVPSPPSSVMSTTSPDIVQWTSVRDASWKTRAFVAPARPANVAESTNARSLDRAVDQEEPGEKNGEHDEVERQRLVQVQHPEEGAARDRLDAVFTAGEAGLHAEEIDHLRERQRDVREVNALAADRQGADDDAERSRHRGAEEDRQLRWEPPGLRGVRRAVARRAEEGGVAEREEPDVADEEVEGAGEEREAQRLHEKHRVHEERRRREDSRHHPEGDHLGDRHPRHRRGGCVDVFVGRRRHDARPKRPLGLTRSTSAMMTKITVLDASG